MFRLCSIDFSSISLPRLCALLTIAIVSSSCGSSSSSANFGELRAAGAARGITIGSAAATDHFNETDYQSVLGSEFSQLQPEWELKFATVHPRDNVDPNPYDFSRPDQLVAFARDHQMLVRGHTMLWHEAVPAWVKQGGYTSDELGAIAQDHITTVASHYRGQIYAWDVVNEAFNDDGTLRSTIWYDAPGIGYAGQGTRYIEQALRWTHKADPDAALFYNEYGAETRNAKSDAVYAMARDFRRRGVPLAGIGFQMHLDLSFANEGTLESFRSNMKRFSDLGMQIHITEMDVRLDGGDPAELDAQAKIYREVARACVETKGCTSLQTWGFTDKHSWIDAFYPGKGWGLLWDRQYAKKPSYFSTLNALENR